MVGVLAGVLRWRRVVIPALGVLMALGGCGGARSGKPVAVASIFAYFDALRAIGGEEVDCRILLPARQSPHEYEPTVSDKALVEQAQLIVENGLGVDAWIDRLREGNARAAVVDVGKLIEQRGIGAIKDEQISLGDSPAAGGEENSAADNAHIWLDPRVQAVAAEAIRDALIKLDPAHKDAYQRRAKVYLQQLADLDRDFADATRTFAQKDFIGFHSAYAYLARRYGLHQVAVVEELPNQGPSLSQQAKIIQLIRQHHIAVIFTESAFPAKAADRILEETHVRTGVLQPLETYDDLSQSYVSLMRDNLAAMKSAMQTPPVTRPTLP